MVEKIYYSLDEAREELRNRWSNTALKDRIEAELNSKFMFKSLREPIGYLARQVCSPDNGFIFFYQCAKYINSRPLVPEFTEDIFVSFNEEKKGLGRLHVALKDDTKATVDIMNFHENEKRKLCECVLMDGTKLVDFHHGLMKILGYDSTVFENSKWFSDIGNAKEYYYYLFLHFISHGVLFETFFDEGISNEDKFTREVIYPAIEKIEKNFGMRPLIVRSFPGNQEDAEDFYWWSYPPVISDYILNYAKTHEIKIKNIE